MNITVYTTPTCAFCTQVKDFYKENGVEYTERDVSVDTDSAKEMVDISGQMGVPVSVIKKDDDSEPVVIVGFDKAKLSETLGL